MLGLDTNVIVRYLAQDDPVQSPKATKVIDGLDSNNKGFISLITIVEMVWVMQGPYKATKPEIINILNMLLQVSALEVENAAAVLQAVRVFTSSNADFADCLIERLGHNAGCKETKTFDTKAAKSAGMQLIS